MRPEPNNDIDLLLRQLSRRNGVPVSGPEEQHLDADELNSYVANALPAAARARYTEHLADCSSCRKLVAQLSAAEGPVTVQQTASAVAPSGLKSFLASLFSPMVLRYAVPAVGLIVIAAIGVFVFRPDQGGRVAQLSEETRSVAVPVPQQEAPASSSPEVFNDGLTNRSETKEAPQREAVPPVTKETERAKSADDAGSRGDTAGASAGAAPAAPKVTAPVVVHNEAPPATATADSAKGKKEQAETAAVQAALNEPIKRDYDSRESTSVVVTPGQTTRNDVQVKTAQRGATPMGGGSLARAPAKSRAESKSKEDSKDAEETAETRSVAGRHFRKSAGVWIDTAYDSSKPITSVARGSEQYRALVGDEPSLKTIADELDGQIVVVWKGRTYRIR